MSAQQTTQALLKEYQKRLREDIKSLKENFQEIIVAAKCEEKSQLGKTTAALYDKTQIQVRAAKIVHAGENLLKLISELKTFLVIHDFPAINETIKRRNDDLNKQCKDMRENLLKIREELGEHLIPGEDEFYSSLRPFEQAKNEYVVKNEPLFDMGHENIWFAHKGKNTKGKGFRQCRITGCRSGLIRKYGLNVSRRAFREIASMVGFQKLD